VSSSGASLKGYALEILVAIAIGLQAWTLSNVVDVRERVARLEARSSHSPARAPAAGAAELEIHPRGPRIVALGQAVDDRPEDRPEVVGFVQGAAHRHAELYERLRTLRGFSGPP
jgi:hypothetical protein